ncbi:MAG TPA: ABC transporter ATP-binding protein [Chloroflexota bacterium]|nr:ABC transporter ATP-binding protein [Chloroflexota bacterium]
MSAQAELNQLDRSVLPQLLAVVRPWQPHLLLVALLVVAAALAQLVPPLIVKRVVDGNLTVGRTDGLLLLAGLYLAATAGSQALTFGYSYLAAVVAQGALNTLRVRLFARLQALPMAYYDQTPLGDSISRCTADVETIDVLFSSGVATLVANLALVLAAGAAMVALSPPLALLSALVLPVLLTITRFFQKRVRQAERANRLAVGSVNAHLQESLGGVDVIRAFGREGTFARRFRTALRDSLLASNRSSFYSSFYTPVTAILSALVVALILGAGTSNVLRAWGISVGTLTAFILLFQRFFQPITDLGDQWQTVQSALAGAERIFQILALPAEAGSEGQLALSHRAPPIELRGVQFGYLPGRPVVHGVSLRIERGEQVALVGRTGAGKTSILHLVAGLYAPWSGTVRVAGIDPRSVSADERRRLIGVVPQAVHLFSGTIRENLTLRDPSVPLAGVEAAAGLVGIDAAIRSLPLGYDTPLGGVGRGQGVRLSAGQEQLLALARALVWNPPVLLLDEATSTVDSASDAAFRAALTGLVRTRGMAVLTIAHRLSTAREADRVIVLDYGAIVEAGTPEELVHRGGRFAGLLELEASGWDWQSAVGAPIPTG